MANPTKFISVNLNKSYGQNNHHHQPQRPSSSPYSLGNGFGFGSHGRIGSHGGSRGGGGMVVLSRPRSSVVAGQKSGARLSVPPPMNLPSLRMEHERSDPSSTSGSLQGAGSSGLGSGHGSSAMGWIKPSLLPAFQDKDGCQDRSRQPGIDDQRPGSASYTPPGAGQPLFVAASTRAFPVAEKAVVLRGEDFPSLLATLSSTQKQKDSLNQKQKEVSNLNQKQAGEDTSDDSVEKPNLGSPLPMRPQMQSSRLTGVPQSNGDLSSNHRSDGPERSHKLDGLLPGPLPVVRLRHTSDWADDERDTGHAIPDRDRDRGYSRTEPVRGHDYSDRRDLHYSEVGSVLPRDFFRVDSLGRDVHHTGRDASSWRAPSHSRDGFVSREVGIDREGNGTRSLTFGRDNVRESSKNSQLVNADSAWGSSNNMYQDSRHTRRDSIYRQNMQNGKNVPDAYSARSFEQNGRGGHGDSSSNRCREDALPNNAVSKVPFSSGSKGLSLSDPILNFGRDRRPNSGRSYLEDISFDSRDPFSGELIGDINVKAIRRKKDVLKQADFRDPVRESFEAELEMVQRMQEEERRRVLDEQVRALELACKEEEERERIAKEEDERRRKLEDEAREAAWRAEQEKLEAAKRAEEQRMSREEEKKRILMEEERRKEAARQKLLQLEARIARRQAEEAAKEKIPVSVDGDQMAVAMKERDAPRVSDIGEWDDGERMVERITNSASSDSPSMNRFFETGSSLPSSRDEHSSFMERGKQTNSWKRDAYDNGNSTTVFSEQENGYHRREAFNSGRVFSRKGFFDGPGTAPTSQSSKSGISEPPHMLNDFQHLRGQRWNVSGDCNQYNKNTEADQDLLETDKFGEIGWGQSHSRGSPHAVDVDSLFQNSDVEVFSSFGRSRHSLKQPRVLPPPSFSSVSKSSLKGALEPLSSSAYLDNEYQSAGTNYEGMTQQSLESDYQKLRQPGTIAPPQENVILLEQNEERNTPGCDSQSSVSVSSPPSSPTHLSHDELDDSRDLPAFLASSGGKLNASSDDENAISFTEMGSTKTTTVSISLPAREDDEWTAENYDEIQEQEEYNDEDDYEEEVEVHEGDDYNLDLGQDGQQLILGFNEGAEVKIPSDDEIERTSRNGESDSEAQTVFCAVKGPGSFERLVNNDGHSLHAENALLDGTGDAFNVISDTEKALQSLVLEPGPAITYPVESLQSSVNSELPVQQPVTSAFTLPSPTISLSQPSLSSVSAATTSQTEAPVKLQFGLFSGPSLIPSPVPAIQIGSIQMPLHLHPPIGPSIAHVHPPQPPFFQFGQLRYTSPISQGVLQLNHQNFPFIQSSVPAQYSLNQKQENTLHDHMVRDSSSETVQTESTISSLSVNNQHSAGEKPSDLYQEKLDLKEQNASQDIPKNDVLSLQGQMKRPYVENRTSSESVSKVEIQATHSGTSKNTNRSGGNSSGQQSEPYAKPISSQFFSAQKAPSGSRRPGRVSGGRGKRYVYTVKNSGSTPSFPESETLRPDSGAFQRRARRNIRHNEFRVRENDKKRFEAYDSLNYIGQDKRLNSNVSAHAISLRNGTRRETFLNRSSQSTVETESLTTATLSPQNADLDGKKSGKEATSKKVMPSPHHSYTGDGSLKRNGGSEEDIDAPLQSGVVRIFRQPGIETPTDEDDFIEVRSKRQMLNDRREKREKEIKAKSRVIKAPRKSRSLSQNNVVPNMNKVATSLGGDSSKNISSDSFATEMACIINGQTSTPFTTNLVSHPLPPIGPPALNADCDTRSHSKRFAQTTSSAANTSGGTLILDNKNTTFNAATSSLGSWSNAHVNQQVMSLTQTQLDEAMKPACFETCGASINDHAGISAEQEKPSTIAQDKPFPPSVSQAGSLLTGEKIQFGAVTAPTFLPPVNRSLPDRIGPIDSSCWPDVSVKCLPSSANDCTVFFEKEKGEESCAHVEDPEAEAAASAVAVAAISSDEMLRISLGSTAVSVSDCKNFGSGDVSSSTSEDMTGIQEVTNHSTGEESLTVTLPADLSVETPVLWPVLPNHQSSSSPMLSHFPGVPPSHFPCFEMNPMLRGPIFAFGPHDESVGTQSQPQRSATLGPGQLGTWPQCQSGMESFYGPPGGFTGSFIGPPGGVPGVQAPSHLVFYNHFPPLAQFGLSFMGATTCIPSGKQPDWKHIPVSSEVGANGNDMSNRNVGSGSQNPPSIPAPIQHIAPGSPLMPMASPLPMFNMSPFQTSIDLPLQAQWSHLPPHLRSVPLSPLQQHFVDGGMPSQSNNMPVDSSSGSHRFPENQSSAPTDGRFSFPADPGAKFPDELVLVDTPSSDALHIQTSRPSYKSSSGNSGKEPSIVKISGRMSDITSCESVSTVTNRVNSNSSSMGSATKPSGAPSSTSASQQYVHPSGYTEKRGVASSQRTASGGEWHHRMGPQGRNNISRADKNFATSKMKQIYIAKPPASGSAT